MAVVIGCHLCVLRGKEPFQVPYDTEGAMAMKEHLAEHAMKGED